LIDPSPSHRDRPLSGRAESTRTAPRHDNPREWAREGATPRSDRGHAANGSRRLAGSRTPSGDAHVGARMQSTRRRLSVRASWRASSRPAASPISPLRSVCLAVEIPRERSPIKCLRTRDSRCRRTTIHCWLRFDGSLFNYA
jgi:hypothetical protein